jgi:hypothetical protein
VKYAYYVLVGLREMPASLRQYDNSVSKYKLVQNTGKHVPMYQDLASGFTTLNHKFNTSDGLKLNKMD